MPIYTIQKCQCGYEGDVFAKVADLNHGRVPCCKCGAYCDQNMSNYAVGVGNRRFHAEVQRSVAEGWTKRTAKKAGELLNSRGHTDAANCIDTSTGRVHFKDREEQQKYAKAMYELRVEKDPSIAD